MQQDVLLRIKSDYRYLSSTNKRIADVILNDPAAFVKTSIKELAERADVSQGSVNNFANRLCGEGFAALKLSVAAELHKSTPKTDSIHSEMERRSQAICEVFKNTLACNGEQELKKAADNILAAHRITVIGIYHSAITARDFTYQLLRLGISASFISDSLMFAVSSLMMTENDLVIAISASGRSKEVVDAAQTAAANGAPVIAITSNGSSPLSRHASLTLNTAYSGIAPSDVESDEESRMSQLLVCDTICSYIRKTIDSGDTERLARLKALISSHNVED